MRQLWILTILLAVASVESVYSKYGRSCNDIGCMSTEECVMEEDVCTIKSKGHCGKYPTCKRVSQKATTCDNYICPSTQVCEVKNKEPRCVNKDHIVPSRHRRQSYNPDSPMGDQSTPKSEPKYPKLHDTTPNAPARRITTERPNVYQIGYTQSQNMYPTQAGTPTQKPQSNGYPSHGYQNQGYPSQGYPNQGYSNHGYPNQGYNNGYPQQGYPSQGYPNQGYPNQRYPNQGYPNQGYPNQGYPNQGYPNQGYPNQGYPNQGYPNQGYPNQGYPNQGYPNQGYPNQGYPNQGYPNQGYPNQGYPNMGYPGYQNPGYQNPGYGGPPGYNQQGQGNQPGFFDPILNTLSKTVTQIGASYIRDKLFNNNNNNNQKSPQYQPQ